jgi:hypothetical protein
VRGEGILTAIQRNTIIILKKTPQCTGHTIKRNYLGVVVYSALQKGHFLPDIPVIAEKVLWNGGWRTLVRYLITKIHTKKV